MKKCFGFLLFSLLFVMSGCKLEHNSRIKRSQLMSEIKTIETTVRVEVSACTDFSDKTRQSDSLMKTNNLMKQLFPDSEFEGCKMENMNSIATYTTPMDVGAFPPDTKEYEPKGVSIIRNKRGNTFFFLSKEIRKSIADSKNDVMVNDIVLYVTIRFINDADTDFTFFPHAIFVDGTPFAGLPRWEDKVVLQPKKTAAIVLSDVASEFAILNGVVPVFSEAASRTPDGRK